jgi:hypothetical protein
LGAVLLNIKGDTGQLLRTKVSVGVALGTISTQFSFTVHFVFEVVVIMSRMALSLNPGILGMVTVGMEFEPPEDPLGGVRASMLVLSGAAAEGVAPGKFAMI